MWVTPLGSNLGKEVMEKEIICVLFSWPCLLQLIYFVMLLISSQILE